MYDLRPGTKKYSKIVACAALLNCGWRVHTSDCYEEYDILATDPINRDHVKINVTRVYQDKKRGGHFVSIKNTNNKHNLEYIIGVLDSGNGNCRAFLFENKMKNFYHTYDVKASERWIELGLNI